MRPPVLPGALSQEDIAGLLEPDLVCGQRAAVAQRAGF